MKKVVIFKIPFENFRVIVLIFCNVVLKKVWQAGVRSNGEKKWWSMKSFQVKNLKLLVSFSELSKKKVIDSSFCYHLFTVCTSFVNIFLKKSCEFIKEIVIFCIQTWIYQLWIFRFKNSSYIKKNAVIMSNLSTKFVKLSLR